MTELSLAPGEALYYEYIEPTGRPQTFVFVNALTGSVGMWAGEICKGLQLAGYGTLCFNFRGQERTTFASETLLTPKLIVDDICILMDHVKPPSPILVGLSIGGLFAAQAYLAGVNANGLVLINTLRKPGQRLDWINRAMVELAGIGGSRMVMMANMPVIASSKLMDSLWESTFDDSSFEAPEPKDGLFRLMSHSINTEWDFPYEKLKVPVMILTGKHDRLFRVDADIAELKSRINDVTEVHYPDAGHLIPVEEPGGFIEDLLGFGLQCAKGE